METDDCVKMFIGFMLVVLLIKFAASLDEEKSDGPIQNREDTSQAGAIWHHYTTGYKKP